MDFLGPTNMMSGAVIPAAPFSLNGSWETGMEGWSSPQEVPRGNDPGTARTGSYRWGAVGAEPFYLDLALPAATARGLRITASVYQRSTDAVISSTRSLQYRIGAGSFVTLASVTNNLTSYALLSGNFLNNANASVTIRLAAANRGYFDDWAISGELP